MTHYAANKYAAKFPPTSIDYQVYPWKDPAQTSATMTNNLDANGLCYLMMSGSGTPPVPANLQYSGAFIDDASKPGVFSMNRDIFWNSWLLPLLQSINQGAELIPETPYVEYTSGREYPFGVNVEASVGDNPKHLQSDDSYFQFVADPSNNNRWTWVGDNLQSSNSAEGGGDKETVTQTCK